jgi:hypothetical protein
VSIFNDGGLIKARIQHSILARYPDPHFQDTREIQTPRTPDITHDIRHLWTRIPQHPADSAIWLAVSTAAGWLYPAFAIPERASAPDQKRHDIKCEQDEPGKGKGKENGGVTTPAIEAGAKRARLDHDGSQEKGNHAASCNTRYQQSYIGNHSHPAGLWRGIRRLFGNLEEDRFF